MDALIGHTPVLIRGNGLQVFDCLNWNAEVRPLGDNESVGSRQ